jgi:hypothetical protein
MKKRIQQYALTIADKKIIKEVIFMLIRAGNKKIYDEIITWMEANF